MTEQIGPRVRVTISRDYEFILGDIKTNMLDAWTWEGLERVAAKRFAKWLETQPTSVLVSFTDTDIRAPSIGKDEMIRLDRLTREEM